MDIFKVLSRGATIKKDGKHKKDLAIFQADQDRVKKSQESLDQEIDREVDFFKSKSLKKAHKREEKKKQPKKEEFLDEESEEEDGDEVPLVIANEGDALEQRKATKTKVTGEDIPLPIGSFSDLKTRFKLHPHLMRNLQRQNFDKPTPIQSESIPVMLKERDLIACAPTGSGKTLAFVIPLVQALKQHSSEGIRCLILSPTKELARQIYDVTIKLSRGRDLNVCILNKANAAKFQHEVLSKQKFDILISTPKRLVDTLDHIDLSRVQHVVFDEADKLFEGEKEIRQAEKRKRKAGSDDEEEEEKQDNRIMRTFAAQSDAILAACTNVKLRKAMFSATIPSGVEDMANSIMVDPVRVIVGVKEGASDTIEQKLVYAGTEQGKLIAIRQMIAAGEFVPPVIIFVQSIQRAKALFHELIYDKINVDAIHSEKTAAQRDKTIERFRLGEIWVLICTDVLARGIDFHGVNLVINYDVPQTSQAYVHRIGRTGRAGKSGRAVTFFTKDDWVAVKNVVNVMKQSGQPVGEWVERLTKITKKQKLSLRHNPVERKEISTTRGVKIHDQRKRKHMAQRIDKTKRLKSSSSDQLSSPN
ncbi:ATP-dependent RNA helicase Rok1p [Trichomonascus vanleenenianus]|uniref:RNA-dependent ATPase ROK1 n=1 Tax=Trichomonascus vanleenenianus TaxID=2268995 RepID=UPI003ECAC866